MSRTKRYVPHYVIRDALHPYIDPTTGMEYVWGSPERQQYYKQREASNLRGQDGRHRHSEHWGYRWMEPMDAVRTHGRKLMLEGYQDHLDALEDEGKIFDWRGYSNDSYEIWSEQIEDEMDKFWHDEYLRELEEEEREFSSYIEDAYYDDIWYDMY